MKSTISITGGPAAVPAESAQMPLAVPVADDVASAGEVAELKARNQQLQRDLDAALASDDSSAKAEFLREKSALQTTEPGTKVPASQVGCAPLSV